MARAGGTRCDFFWVPADVWMYGPPPWHAAHPDLPLGARAAGTAGCEAIDSFLERQQPESRLVRLRQARGLWADREDLPSWPDLRLELDRQPIAGS